MREKITDLLKAGTDHVRSLLSQSRVARCIGIAVLVLAVLISGIPHYVAAVGLELVCGVYTGGVSDGLTPASGNRINSRIKHLHRTRYYASYDRETLTETANSLSADYRNASYAGYYVKSFTWEGNTYYVNGLMEKTTYLSAEEIGGVPEAELIRCEEGFGENTTADTGITLHLYQVGDIDPELALAAWFEEGDGFYYFMNSRYAMEGWTLTEILKACGFTEDSDIYVWLYPHSRAFNIYYVDVPGKYLWDEVISEANTTCSEYTGDKTGMVVYLTSEITGASVWLRFLEGGSIVLCDVFSGFWSDYTCGVPEVCQNLTFDMGDEELKVGLGLLDYLAKNCEGMISYEWWW
ncbi:MAG: hypothetical protein LUE29_10350 [Lachnospiraceae bacterium]|nr:hypothetical protein [Lachnospiraceae bacterium]